MAVAGSHPLVSLNFLSPSEIVSPKLKWGWKPNRIGQGSPLRFSGKNFDAASPLMAAAVGYCSHLSLLKSIPSPIRILSFQIGAFDPSLYAISVAFAAYDSDRSRCSQSPSSSSYPFWNSSTLKNPNLWNLGEIPVLPIISPAFSPGSWDFAAAVETTLSKQLPRARPAISFSLGFRPLK